MDFNETGLVVTEPYFNFTSITEAMSEIFFEEYQFKSVFKCNRKLPLLLSYRKKSFITLKSAATDESSMSLFAYITISIMCNVCLINNIYIGNIMFIVIK